VKKLEIAKKNIWKIRAK